MIDGMDKKYKVITLEEVNDLMTESQRHKQVQEIIVEVENIIKDMARHGRREAILKRYMESPSPSNEKYTERNLRDVMEAFSQNGFITELELPRNEGTTVFSWRELGEIGYHEPRNAQLTVNW